MEQSDLLPETVGFNAEGNGYPDVSVLASNFVCYINGTVFTGSGTSASSPTFAGIVAILNSVRLKTGQPALGFLNPFLYTMHADYPQAFTDVISGDNRCTEHRCDDQCEGFEATKGWDPVSGLGTPNVDEMIAYIMSQA